MKITEVTKNRSERSARHQLVEDLFYDFNSSRHKIYLINFVRGVFFGFGTVLGGTVLVAIIIWILSQVAGWFPGIGTAVHHFIDALQNARL